MRYVLVVAALAALLLAPWGAAPAQDRPTAESSATVRLAKPVADAGHDVWELRLVLLTPTRVDGLDLRLEHLMKGESPTPGTRCFTVSAVPDPEALVANLRKLGTIEVLERANLPVAKGRPARYVSGSRIPVPQVETRSQDDKASNFVRMKFEEIGTKLRFSPQRPGLQADIEASFLLTTTEPYGYPVIAHVSWQTDVDLPPGRTAVFRTHYRLPGSLLGTGGAVRGAAPGAAVPGAPRRVPAARTDLGRVLVALLTRSRLP